MIDRQRPHWRHDARPEEDEDERVTRSLAALAVVLVLVVGGLLLVQRLRATAMLQDCVMTGRHNCAPIEAPARHK